MPVTAHHAQIELHCHSTASDGQLRPADLVRHAFEAGVRHLALTDHDTVAGLPEAASACADAGMAFVSGVELSCTWQNKTLHIVGLDFDPAHPALQACLQELAQRRRQRSELIAQRLEKVGLQNGLSRAQQAAQMSDARQGQITRTHFARLLVEDRLAKDLKQAFKKFLGAGKIAAPASDWISLDEAILAIQQAGGLAVLAHPLRYGLSGAWRQRMLAAFKQAGGDALEVSCGASQNPNEREILARAARDFDLLASIGSDFHGPEQHWLRQGRLAALPSDLIPVWDRFSAAKAESRAE